MMSQLLTVPVTLTGDDDVAKRVLFQIITPHTVLGHSLQYPFTGDLMFRSDAK
jgi:hypothetical protein